MALFNLNNDPSTRDLRWFAGLWFPAFCALGGTALWRKFDQPAAAVSIWTVGALLGIAGLCAPRLIRPVYTTLMRITFPLGWVLSHVLLLAMYFAIITPFGALVRRFHDPMARRFDRAAKSYWMAHEPRSQESYLRQL